MRNIASPYCVTKNALVKTQLNGTFTKLRSTAQRVKTLLLTQLTHLRMLGYWHQRADERHGNPSPGNQELLVVKDKVARPPGEIGVSKSMECNIFPFSALTLLVGRQDGHPACKKLDVGLLVVMI